MRFAIWATVLLAPCLALGCAAQSAEHERQVKELEARVRQLSTKCDRLEERVLAVEAVERFRTGPARAPASTTGERPDLPTVKAGPTDSVPESVPIERNADATSDDTHRLMIVGEGTRVETRLPGETRPTPPASNSSKANTHAAKRSTNSVPGTGTSSSGSNP